jgi:hypothetical protein
VVAAADRRSTRLIRFVRADDDGFYPEEEERWAEIPLTGRSVQHLRNQLALGVASFDIIMCVRAGRYGRLTPLVVDLPSGRNGDIIEIVVYMVGTPGESPPLSLSLSLSVCPQLPGDLIFA